MPISAPAASTAAETRVVAADGATHSVPGEMAKTGQRIGVPREIFPGEKRVASVPEAVEKLIKLGFLVLVESGAGAGANVSDEDYRASGATVVPTAAQLWPAQTSCSRCARRMPKKLA